jgi:hypothetical protein
VYFDAIGIRWEYEPESFVGPAGSYLPDFLLPETWWFGYGEDFYPLYVEVKPSFEALQRDSRRIGECVGNPVTALSRGLLILGPIPDPRAGVPVHSLLYWDRRLAHLRAVLYPRRDHWYAGAWPRVEEQDKDRLSYCTPLAGAVPYVWLDNTADQRTWIDRVRGALNAARSARFEHGESGAT